MWGADAGSDAAGEPDDASSSVDAADASFTCEPIHTDAATSDRCALLLDAAACAPCDPAFTHAYSCDQPGAHPSGLEPGTMLLGLGSTTCSSQGTGCTRAEQHDPDCADGGFLAYACTASPGPICHAGAAHAGEADSTCCPAGITPP